MHAYLIIAHDQFELLESLLKCIDDERNDIYIHVDSHSKLDISRIQSVLQNSRVEFVPRIHIRWGGFDMVDASMSCSKLRSRADENMTMSISSPARICR